MIKIPVNLCYEKDTIFEPMIFEVHISGLKTKTVRSIGIPYFCRFCMKDVRIGNLVPQFVLGDVTWISCVDCLMEFNFIIQQIRDNLLYAYIYLRANLISDVARLVAQIWLQIEH